MNVPNDILQNLKCSNCEDLLSCGPVKLKSDGSNICGRCSNLKLEDPLIINEPYNSFAQFCVFPCKYEAEGCVQRVPFDDIEFHEEDCPFRTYYCPILQSGSCEWIGPKNKLLEHVQESHPDHVLVHPAKQEHYVRTPSFKTYLMAVYKVLFLVHVKVCLTTHTIYHSIRKIGKNDYKDHMFKFFVKIENEKGTLTRTREVAPQGPMVLQEDSSIGIKINTIMEALNGLDNIKFTITIDEYMKCLECEKIKHSKEIKIYDKFPIIRKFYCNQCFLTLKPCNASQECSWRGGDTNIHDIICSVTNRCKLCNEIMSGSHILLEHMHLKHGIEYLSEQFYTILKHENNGFTFLFKNRPFIFIFKCGKASNIFLMYGDIKIQCSLIIKNSKTKRTSHYLMQNVYTSNIGQHFFQLLLNDNHLESFLNDNQFEVGIDIHCY